MATTLSASSRLGRPLTILAAFAAVLVSGAALLWGYYGTTVFFEMVRAGWAACF
jgi:hypothetical protein